MTKLMEVPATTLSKVVPSLMIRPELMYSEEAKEMTLSSPAFTDEKKLCMAMANSNTFTAMKVMI